MGSESIATLAERPPSQHNRNHQTVPASAWVTPKECIVLELTEAIRHALDGKAVLFVGAGFAVGARNELGEAFPGAGDLSSRLMSEIGESEVVPLQISSQLYVQERGNVALLAFLNKLLSVQEPGVSSAQKAIASVPWRRIYTTNYDNIVETCCHSVGMKHRSFDRWERLPASTKNCVDIVHINGFLPKVDIRNIETRLLLSETSYVTEEFVESSAFFRFQEDLRVARAVIFVGYSLYDLDISRALASVAIKHKTVFVTGSAPTRALKSKLELFGGVFAVGTDGFADNIAIQRATYVPEKLGFAFESFKEISLAKGVSASPGVDDHFSLFINGSWNFSFISRDIVRNSEEYCVRRGFESAIIQDARAGTRFIFIIGRMANGKTTALMRAALSLVDEFAIYYFEKELSGIDTEIDEICRRESPTLLIFDDYVSNIELISRIAEAGNKNVQFFLAARTPWHITERHRLDKFATAPGSRAEYRVDPLARDELVKFDGLLSAAGLLGAFAGQAHDQRMRFYERECANEISGILLKLLNSPEILRRLRSVIEQSIGDIHKTRVMIAAFLLGHLGARIDIFDLATLIGARAVNQIDFSERAGLSDILQIQDGAFWSRSSIFSAASMQVLADRIEFVDILTEILRNSWGRRNEADHFYQISVGLMRYSKVKEMFSTSTRMERIGKYYDAIRNTEACSGNQFFWQQVALYDIDKNDFVRAKSHLDTAYGIARRLAGFDPYQLDNIYARYLLARQIYVGGDARSFADFVDASRIISRQTKEKRDRYYAFRVARMYVSFWKTVSSAWDAGQTKAFIASCEQVLRAINSLEDDLRGMGEIGACERDLQRLLHDLK